MTRKLYKDVDGVIYEYEADGSQDSLIGDKVALTATEIEAIINPPKTPEQLLQEASKLRDEAMLKGFVYNGMDISVTKDDGDSMVQVKVSFELGLTSTVIHFANGSKLPMTAEEFPAFALQFVTERGKFFS